MLDQTVATQQGNIAPVANFLNLLVGAGYIAKEDLLSIKSKYPSALDLLDSLKSLNTIPENELNKMYAKSLNIPYIELTNIDESAYNVIDKSLADRFGLIPFSIDQNAKILQIALTDPRKFSLLNQSAVSQLEDRIGFKIEFFMTTKRTENDLEEKNVSLLNRDISLETLEKFPLDLATKYRAIIFAKESDNVFLVAATNPDDQQLKEVLSFVENKSGIKLKLFKTSDKDMDFILEKYRNIERSNNKLDEKQPIEKNKTEIVNPNSSPNGQISLENPDLATFLGKNDINLEDIKGYANRGEVPQLVASMIFLAVRQRASDIHIEPFEKSVRVRFRIDGELSEIIATGSQLASSIAARIKILAKLKIDEQRVPQDGRIEASVNRELVDIRVSTLPTVFGEKVVMRLLSKSKSLERLEDLGLDGMGYDRVIKAIRKPYGVLLSTGPTGSGKSTTLYSVLSMLNKSEVNIVTLEDPVEYEIQGINQVQVKPQIGFGFADGLRSVLRQDPNVVMVGEIRDKETAELVTHAALTGHMVLSTLHTNNAAGALPRLFNLGVEPFLLTSAVNAVIGQRLVRRVCSKCREEIDVPQSVIYEAKRELEKINFSHPIKFFKGKGCSECKNGYKGRVGIFEVLEMSPSIEDFVLQNKSVADIFTQATKEGMISMRQDGIIKAVKGLTTIDEVLRVTSETKEEDGSGK